jgi:hypothetical protein
LEQLKVKQSFKEFYDTRTSKKRVYTVLKNLAPSEMIGLLSFISMGYDSKQNGRYYIFDKTGYMELMFSTGTTHGSPEVMIQ